MNLRINSVLDGPRLGVPDELVRTHSPVQHLAVCHDWISRPDLDLSRLAWLTVYLRVLGNREVRQGMRGNYQTKDISHLQNVFSLGLSGAYAETYSHGTSDEPLERALIRSMVALAPRGGGNGDQLRLFILDVMRRHGIREGHRPGIDDPFIEQWHQKLHSWSTPEDIAICEAYLAFQESGSVDHFYHTLWQRGGITVEQLRSMPRPLTHHPRHMPQLIPDLKHLLWILKQVHAGSGNLHYLIEVSRWQLDGDTLGMLESIRDNFGAWWLPGRVVEARRRLHPQLRSGTPRDPLMLDVNLDGVFKTSVERIDLRALGRDDLFALVGLALENLSLSYDDERVFHARSLWERLGSFPVEERGGRSWSLRAFAALSSVQMMIQACSEDFYRVLQPRAESLGAELGVPPAYITNFAEEVIRSQGLFCLAQLVDALGRRVREAAGVGPWTWVSHGTMVARGTVTVARSLSSVADRLDGTPHIVLADEVDGTEDLPEWASAVITSADVDLLSHVAIRARAAGIVLATCLDDSELARLRQLAGTQITLRIRDGLVEYEPVGDGPSGAPVSGSIAGAPPEPARARPRSAAHGSARSVEESGEPSSRSKSGNLARLAARVPELVRLPLGVALEPELFDRALAGAPERAAEIRRLEAELATRDEDRRVLLAEIQTHVRGLPLGTPLVAQIEARLAQSGVLAGATPAATEAVCQTIKRVWASLWNERAHTSRLRRGVPRERVRMGVLVQRSIPAEYAFVVHTRHPVLNDPEAMLVEVVVGLGETLAGNAPGRPLRAAVRRGGQHHVIEAYPSKPLGAFDATSEGTLIVRSDSSDEDQQEFSGAGLYDSYFVAPPRIARVSYAGEKLCWDEEFQRGLLASIAGVAEAVERVMGAPQDIEGVFRAGHIYVVQTRDQTGCS